MNRTFSRKEAAKKLNTTAAALKELEANGTVVPLRDAKKVPRYLEEHIEMLRPVIASMAPPPMMPLQLAPPPTQAQAMTPQVTPQPVELYPPAVPQPEQPFVEPLTQEELAFFCDRFRMALATEAARFNVSTQELVEAWRWATQPVEMPQSFGPLVVAWAGRLNVSIGDFWQMLINNLREAPAPEPKSYIPPAPPVTASPFPYSSPPIAPQYQTPHPNPYATPFVSPAAQVRPRYSQSRAASYYQAPQWGAPGYAPFAFAAAQPQSDFVREAQNLLEVQQIEMKRRHMERFEAEEEAARQRTEAAQANREAEAKRAQVFGLAQAQADLQYREKQAAMQREEAQRYTAEQAEELRRQRAEQEQIERAVASIFADIPTFVPPEVVENLRAQAWTAIQGRSAVVAPAIARDIVNRAVAPYLEEARRMELRRKVAEIAIGTDQLFFFRDGPEAKAVAAQAAQDFLDSGAADHMDFFVAVNEARRVRDVALEEFKRRRAAEEAVQQEV